MGDDTVDGGSAVIRGASHVAIGVSDMERSLAFYRDVLGMRVAIDDPSEDPGGQLANVTGRAGRHGVYLRWADGPGTCFLVLSEDRPPSGRPVEIDEVGIHHVGLWVAGLREIFERISAFGSPVIIPPTEYPTTAYGEPLGGRVLSTIVRDPDGAIIQLDERLP